MRNAVIPTIGIDIVEVDTTQMHDGIHESERTTGPRTFPADVCGQSHPSGQGVRADGLPNAGELARGATNRGMATTKAQHEMQGGLLLDVVIGKSATVLELLAGEDQTLLIRGDTLLVLDLGLHILDGIGSLDLEGDGLAREGLDENLHGSDDRCSGIKKLVLVLESITCGYEK